VDRYEQYNQLADPKTKADVFKESGNRIMKESKNYGEAVPYYTKAIALYDQEPAYFFNRGVCHLRLGSYQDSLDDFDAAIALNDKYSKAYFNRMKVLMALERHDLALKDYYKVCELSPAEKRVMKREYDILLEKTAPKKDWSVWSSKPNAKRIEFVEKAPHLRSKKPLTRLPITEMISPTTSHTYSDAVIDKLFNNNTGEYTPDDDEPRSRFSLFSPYYASKPTVLAQPVKTTVQETPPPKSVHTPTIIPRPGGHRFQSKVMEPLKSNVLEPPKPVVDTADEVLDLSIEASNLPSIPRTVQQFYSTWATLKDVQKFLYLRQMEASKDFGQLLGSGFESDMLSDLLRIMSVYFVKHQAPVAHLMTEISKNQEFKIISLWMTESDRKGNDEIIFVQE
jgi:RNA polymerase II-associated protein 3